jgi:hypothetical protein
MGYSSTRNATTPAGIVEQRLDFLAECLHMGGDRHLVSTTVERLGIFEGKIAESKQKVV